MPGRKGYPCPDCRGVRLHRVRVIRETVNGHLVKVARIRVCTACERQALVEARQSPGICCPKCGDSRMAAKKTRHRGPGVTVRVRQCKACGHKIRTSESVESFSHNPPRAG